MVDADEDASGGDSGGWMPVAKTKDAKRAEKIAMRQNYHKDHSQHQNRARKHRQQHDNHTRHSQHKGEQHFHHSHHHRHVKSPQESNPMLGQNGPNHSMVNGRGNPWLTDSKHKVRRARQASIESTSTVATNVTQDECPPPSPALSTKSLATVASLQPESPPVASPTLLLQREATTPLAAEKNQINAQHDGSRVIFGEFNTPGKPGHGRHFVKFKDLPWSPDGNMQFEDLNRLFFFLKNENEQDPVSVARPRSEETEGREVVVALKSLLEERDIVGDWKLTVDEAPTKTKSFSWAAAARPTPNSAMPNGVVSTAKAFSISHVRHQSEDDVIPALRVPYKVIRKIVKNFKVSFDQAHMLKRQKFRGLINDGNMCYLNAILHPLVHCIPFHNLTHMLIDKLPETVEGIPPIIGALQFLLSQFDMPDEKEDYVASSFSPRPIYEALQDATNFVAVKGAQEDAEEFLGYLLDGLHEEFVSASKQEANGGLPNGTSEPSWTIDSHPEEAGGWKEVGRANKAVATRTVNTEASPVKAIFGGVLRSVVGRTGSKETATLEPFRTIQLDISSPEVTSLDDALRLWTQREHIDGSFFEKQLFLERVPPILVFALKRYSFSSTEGVTKLHKHVSYPVHLQIPNVYFSNHDRTTGNKFVSYRLFAVVHHHGQIAGSGHYSCDILRRRGKNPTPVRSPVGSPVGSSGAKISLDTHQWMHLDDTDVKAVPVRDVLESTSTRPQTMVPDWDYGSDRLAYLLFYESCDYLTRAGHGDLAELMAEAGLEEDGFEMAKSSHHRGRRRHA